jgi:hypothetical protein
VTPATTAVGGAAEEGVGAAQLSSPSIPSRAAKPRPRPKTQARFGTFSNMMTALSRDEEAGDAVAAASTDLLGIAPAGSPGGGAAALAPAGGDSSERDLATLLFGGGRERPKRVAAAAAPAEPLVDLLNMGDVGGGAGEAQAARGGDGGALGDLDLLGAAAHQPPVSTSDPFADVGRSGAGIRGGGDLLPDLISGLGKSVTPAAPQASVTAGAPARTVNAAQVGGAWLRGHGDPAPMPAVNTSDADSLLADFGLAPAAAAVEGSQPSGGVTGAHQQGQNGAAKQGTLPAKPPKSKGDAFADLLSF